MLESISIKNIALIDDITINLGKGLNVITGETGAGKSLVVGSIALLLGDKADKSLISYDKDYAYIEAVFVSNNKKVMAFLDDVGIDKDSQIIISRKLYKEGKNECRVNGKSLTLSVLKKLTLMLMDLHGQFEHQSILSNDYQLQIIDKLGGENLEKIKGDFQSKFERYQDIKKELASFTEDDKERERLVDLYDYQINEISDANFVDGEEESLKEYRLKVLNIEKIMNALENVSELASNGMDGSGGLADIITKMISLLSSVSQYSKDIEEVCERTQSLRIDGSDIIDTIDSIKDNMDYNEEEAKANEERLDLLNSFKKKYGSSIEEINAYLDKITAERDRLKNSKELIEKLKAEKLAVENQLTKIGKDLTECRKFVAKDFETKITNELNDLAMKNTKFVVDFKSLSIDESTGDGLDKVEYLFSANAGEPVKPLNKIISGGEMSRFMLAVKNITAKIEDIQTMIFDEIDTGVSGFVAGELAKKLLTISKDKQVICVSHLSQVAAYATNQYLITKSTNNGRTHTNVYLMNDKERVDEIARLIGGKITEHSVAHAKMMMQEAKEFYKTIK